MKASNEKIPMSEPENKKIAKVTQEIMKIILSHQLTMYQIEKIMEDTLFLAKRLVPLGKDFKQFQTKGETMTIQELIKKWEAGGCVDEIYHSGLDVTQAMRITTLLTYKQCALELRLSIAQEENKN